MVAAAFLLVSGSASYAQQTDMQQVQSVLTALHTAIASLDVPKIMTLFAHDDYVMSKTPRTKALLSGRLQSRRIGKQTSIASPNYTLLRQSLISTF